jgi:hypothetical protein
MSLPGFNAQTTLYQSPHHYPGKVAPYIGVSRRISSIFHEWSSEYFNTTIMSTISRIFDGLDIIE